MSGRAAIYIVLILALVYATAQAASAPPEIMLDNKVDSMKQAGVGPVKYTHASHEKRNKCSDCHPKIFAEKKGGSGMTMKGNMDGNFCGSANCHNSKKAFPLFECAKCHTQLKTK